MTVAVPNSVRYFALIPAAGVGARMQAGSPKQYLPIAGKPMLRHALDAFIASPLIAHTYVVVSADDGVIDTGWLPYIKAEMRKVETLQAAIDSPQEYARLGKACKGEIQNILAGKIAPAN